MYLCGVIRLDGFLAEGTEVDPTYLADWVKTGDEETVVRPVKITNPTHLAWTNDG